MEWWIFLDWAGVLFFFGCWLKGRWCPSRFYCHKACCGALHVININFLGGDVRLVRRCRLCRRWRLFFGVCVFFSTFAAFSVFSCVFGVFVRFRRFRRFRLFRRFRRFRAFSAVSAFTAFAAFSTVSADFSEGHPFGPLSAWRTKIHLFLVEVVVMGVFNVLTIPHVQRANSL